MGCTNSLDKAKNDQCVTNYVNCDNFSEIKIKQNVSYKDNHLNMVVDYDTPLTRLLKKNIDDNPKNIIKIEEYLKNGADPNIPCIYSDGKSLLSPLFLCCRNSHGIYGYKGIEMLIKYGADVNPVYMPQKTYSPLQICLYKNESEGALKIIQLLLENGADPDLFRSNLNAHSMLKCYYKGPNKKEIEHLLLKYSKNIVKD